MDRDTLTVGLEGFCVIKNKIDEVSYAILLEESSRKLIPVNLLLLWLAE